MAALLQRERVPADATAGVEDPSSNVREQTLFDGMPLGRRLEVARKMRLGQIAVVAAIAGPLGEVVAVEVQYHLPESVVRHTSAVLTNECNSALKYGVV